jgi:signal transduction histidine kinase
MRASSLPVRQASEVLSTEATRIVGLLAHELRTPITRQRVLAEVALADPHADVESLREMGQRIVVTCERQEQVLESLLDLTCGGRIRCDDRVDLARIVADVLPAITRSDSTTRRSSGPRRSWVTPRSSNRSRRT